MTDFDTYFFVCVIVALMGVVWYMDREIKRAHQAMLALANLTAYSRHMMLETRSKHCPDQMSAMEVAELAVLRKASQK